jgi:hypothetical protein
MDIGLELEEVQVSPGSIDCIMNSATLFAAFWTGKLAAGLEIYVNIKLLYFGVEIN